MVGWEPRAAPVGPPQTILKTTIVALSTRCPSCESTSSTRSGPRHSCRAGPPPARLRNGRRFSQGCTRGGASRARPRPWERSQPATLRCGGISAVLKWRQASLMTHPGKQGRLGAPVRSPERSPGGLRASWDPMIPAQTRPLHGSFCAFNQVLSPLTNLTLLTPLPPRFQPGALPTN